MAELLDDGRFLFAADLVLVSSQRQVGHRGEIEMGQHQFVDQLVNFLRIFLEAGHIILNLGQDPVRGILDQLFRTGYRLSRKYHKQHNQS